MGAHITLTSREEALCNRIVYAVIASIESDKKPKCSGLEASEILGLTYHQFKRLHVDAGDIFYIPNTKQFWRKDVYSLRAKREQLANAS